MSTDREEAEVKIDRIIATKRAQKGQFTKLTHRFEDLFRNYHVADPATLSDMRVDMKGIVNSLGSKIEQIKDLDKQILEKTPLDKIEHVVSECDDYIEDCKYQLNRCQNKVDVMTQSTISPNIEHHANYGNESLQSSVNLPKLQLPTFEGSILDWIPFFDAFNAAVHNNKSLSDVQKFQYLSSVLRNEASRAISGLQLSNENYNEAIDILKSRYGQPHKLIASYMKALWELSTPSNMHEVKDFYDKLESYIRGLRSLGKTEDSYGDLLIPIIFEKLPGSLRIQISREHGDNAWQLTELCDAIRHEMQATEAGAISSMYTQPPCPELSSATTLHVATKSRKQYLPGHSLSFTRECTFCKNNHSEVECRVISDKSKRHDYVKQHQLCFNCLKAHHAVWDCKSKFRCRNCQRKHHTSLCNMNDSKSSYVASTNSTQKNKGNVTHVTLTPSTTAETRPVLLKTATANIRNLGNDHNAFISVNILLDEGAQRSFITEAIVNKLQISQRQVEQINLSTFGATTSKSQQVDTVKFTLDTSESPLNIAAIVVDNISSQVHNYVKSATLNHQYLQGLPLAQHVDIDNFHIDILIGADYYWSIVGDQIIRGPGPTAVSSTLGYLLSGPCNIEHSTILNTMVYKLMVSHDKEDEQLTKYWDLETVGITDMIDAKNCEYEQYRDSQIHLKDGRYTASLPWKSDYPPLPTNYDICYSRTRSMVRHLSDDMRVIYDGIIVDQLDRGFIELVPDDDNSQGHYIPHHAVRKDSTTTPIRIVYDCSCKRGNFPSLNDCLDSGPSMINDLVEILLRFRLHPVAFTSDIEKAFLNIQLSEHDRNFTKFLWLSDPQDPNSDFIVYRFKAVLFGSVSSPFILNAVVKSHLELEPNSISHDIKDNIYVDNLVSGTQSDEEAIRYYNHSVDVLKRGGFRLRSWSTNNPTLRELTSSDDNAENDPIVKVLGMIWDTRTDTLSYPRRSNGYDTVVHTKREVIRTTSSLFDPIGLLSPVQVRAKIFIQELWSANLDWDEPLNEDLVNKWIPISDDIRQSKCIVLPRYYFHDMDDTHSGDYELHVFSDASMLAYGAVVYLKRGNGTTFVMSKSRVKPLKETTLPRLELLAAFTATRLTQFVLKTLSHLNISRTVLWCDSQIVIHWIYSNKKLPIFITNRIKVIKRGEFSDIKYCPSKDNPADLLTRGISANDLEQSSLWMRGPLWLADGDWPVCHLFDTSILACHVDHTNDHVCAISPFSGYTAVYTVSDADDSATITRIIDITRFNSLDKLLRVTSYVLRFIRILKDRSTITKKTFTKHITVPELRYSTIIWIKAVQGETYSKELHQIQSGVCVKSSLVNQLKLFMDNNKILRCGGRLHNANIAYSAKHPVLLPNKHAFTHLVIHQSHAMVMHSGLESTMAFIRHTYWIPKLRRIVKRLLHSCVTCIRVSGKSYTLPPTPPLPQSRLTESNPFSYCGVDFTGSLYYKTNSSNMNKAYVCLFTCAVTRAIHLELMTDMSTEAFLRSFRRFISRRGLPCLMISDNATTYVAAAERIKEFWKDSDINQYLASKRMEWTFIPKRAPWFGGFYERLIGITKNILKKTLGKTLLSFDELNTIVVGVEAVINERPITYMSAEAGDLQPLSPAMLLNGRSIILPHDQAVINTIDDPDYGADQTSLNKRYYQLNKIITQCWMRWKSEYLPALREAHISHEKKRPLGHSYNYIQVGDVVLVHCDTEKRVRWPLAIVTKLNFGKDGLARSAEIKTKHGVSNRPIVKLFPLEVRTIPNEPEPNIKTDESMDIASKTSKTKRQASIKAREMIKQLSENSDI